MYDIYFGYVRAWWPYRSDPNVLFMHYSDVRKDLKKWVSKIAKFVEVDLTSDELDLVTQRCTIEHMRKVNRFKYRLPLNTDTSIWDKEVDQIVKDGKMTNKGGVGTGEVLLFFCRVLQLRMYVHVGL